MSPERRRALDFLCWGFVFGLCFKVTMDAAGAESWRWTATVLVIAEVAALVFVIRKLPK